MKKIYFVQNSKTREILNLKGGWSDGPTSYRVATFDSEAAARAAFPADVTCEVCAWNVRDESEDGVKGPPGSVGRSLASSTLTHQFFLQKGNKFLDKDDVFKAGGFGQGAAQPFASKDAALDKAESLGLDLDDVYVVKSKAKEARV